MSKNYESYCDNKYKISFVFVGFDKKIPIGCQMCQMEPRLAVAFDENEYNRQKSWGFLLQIVHFYDTMSYVVGIFMYVQQHI